MNNKLEDILNQAVSVGVNDIFLTEDCKPRFRTGGQVTEVDFPKITRTDFVKLLSGIEIGDDLRELDFSLMLGEQRFRVNAFLHLGKYGAALRPIKNNIPEMTPIGLPSKLLTSWLERQSGIILITGATGSGKSTTIASCIEWINQNMQSHIVTIEDPIEYLFQSKNSLIHQREVGTDTENFATGLRSSLRQSPDVIFVGEIRDLETATTALQAAETGHLVLSTLHSSNVIDSLERLTNIFPPKSKSSHLLLLANHLVGILSQKLVPDTTGHLFLLVEHMQNEGAIRPWIRESQYSEIYDFINKGDNPNNCTFLEYIVAAVRQGAISREVGIKVCDNEQGFRRAMKGIN